MYNGIGIQSTRGTGTSGHVQRNIAALHRTHRRRTINANPNEKLRNALVKKSGAAQRAHEALRRVEVAVAELEEELGARGYDQETITEMAERLRKDLLSRDENEEKGEKDREIEKGRGGSELTEHRNEKLRQVLGVEHDYTEGTAFRNMRLREKRGDAEEKGTTDEAKDSRVGGNSDEGDLVEKTAEPLNTPGDDNELSKADPALSDAESSTLSQSSDESDSDDVPDVRDVSDVPDVRDVSDVPDVDEHIGNSTRPDTEIERESPAKKPSPKKLNEDEQARREGPSVPELPSSPEEPKPPIQASRSPPRSRSMSSSPPRRRERRGRTRSPSPRRDDCYNESPLRREFSPRRRRPSPDPRDDLPRSRDMSPRSRDVSPVRRAPYPYDRYGTPKFGNGSSLYRSPSPRRKFNRPSPYDKRPTPHDSREYETTRYHPRRSRDARPSYRRRSRSRSRSRSRLRSRSRDRYERYRDESPGSTSTSSRSPSPYGRRSSPRDRSLSPRRDASPYGRDWSPRRSPRPYSRKRRYSGYTPPRRVRHRRRSPYGYRRRRRSERRYPDRGYSPSDSDSSRSPPRYGTPPRRSRFSDYPTSQSLTPPRYTRRYEGSPSR